MSYATSYTTVLVGGTHKVKPTAVTSQQQAAGGGAHNTTLAALISLVRGGALHPSVQANSISGAVCCHRKMISDAPWSHQLFKKTRTNAYSWTLASHNSRSGTQVFCSLKLWAAYAWTENILNLLNILEYKV